MYKAIIFDFFDVIRTDAFKSWLKLHNYKLEGEFLEAVKKMDHGDIVPDEFLAILSKITGQQAAEILDEMERDAAVDYDVLALVKDLRKEYRIGLLSNAPSGFLRDLLQTHDLEKYFDEIVISSEVGLVKPDAAVFHHILDKLHIKPGEAIFIDDSQRNIDGARAIGITGVLYLGLDQLKTDLENLLNPR